MDRGAGRFAPSPTGPLHLGSLLTATASWLDARARGDAWHVRIDDLDTPRNRPGGTDSILATLDCHGLHWDGPVRYQSARIAVYERALADLAARDCVFFCSCSRRTVGSRRIYAGTCRARRTPAPGCSIRMRVDEVAVEFHDLVCGYRHEVLAETVGDFVLRRRDGIVAYPLATAVDDGAGEITRVIRGRDLLASTAAQLLVIDRLGLTRPAYGHVPIMVNTAGQKLSKQTHAAPLDPARPLANLRLVLEALGSPAAAAPAGTSTELLAVATGTWSIDHLPATDPVAPS